MHVETGVISIFLLDRIRLSFENTPIAIASRKARSLVALLCLSDSHEISRGALCSMLWPDADTSRARASLRQMLRRLRSDLGVGTQTLMVDHQDMVRADMSAVVLEHEQILRHVHDGKIPQVLLHDQSAVERFLSDIDGLTTELDSWIAVQRRLYQDVLENALGELMVTSGDKATRHQAASALIQLDPTNEHACRTLMRSLAESGQSAAALRVYNELYKILDEEFDIEPVQETMELVAEIKLDKLPAPFKSNTSPSSIGRFSDDRPTICISLFDILNGQPTSDLIKAFAQDLLTVLIRFREWNVVEGVASDDRQNCYLLTGTESINSSGEAAITVMLKKMSNGQYLWSEKLDLTHRNWVSSHFQLARQFAAAIDSNISTDRLLRMKHLVPESRSAFDRWLFCQHINSNWNPEAGDEIVKLLNSIIEDEPLFAPAHAELAAKYNSRHIFIPGQKRSEEFKERALRHSRIALQIDPLDTRSQRVTAWTHLMRGDHDLAELHFGHALELNASNPFTIMSSAQGLAFCGRTERAVNLANVATDLQPALPGFLQGYLVGVNFLHGNFQASVQASRQAGDSISNLPGWEASALWQLGRTDEAKECASRMAAKLAQVWSGPEPMSRRSLADWFIESFPIRDTDKRNQLDEGFRKALELV